MFTHLQVHTHYSLLEAIGSPKAYVEQAKNLGMESLAITDYAGMYGVVEFYQAAKKAGIKPLLWVELGYVPDMNRKDPWELAGMIVLLATSYVWYRNLLHLVSAAHMEWFHTIPRIDAACLREWAGDLISISWWLRSRIGRWLMQNSSSEQLADQRQQLKTILHDDNCFLSWTVQDKPAWKIHEANIAIQSFAEKNGTPLLISGDVHYIHAKDQEIFETALAIKDGKRIYDTDRRLASHQLHLQSTEEITHGLEKAWWSAETITQWFSTIQTIVNRIDITIPMDTILFPKYEVPEDISKLYTEQKEKLIV